jgi:mannose-6-phosphate isomerase-like protein (cupin superfamily)
MNYNIDLEVKFEQLELIDVPEIVRHVTEKWSNRTLTRVNDSVVRLGIVEGEFHWHKHEKDDEFFYVTEGRLLMDYEDPLTKEVKTTELLPGQGITMPKGVMHRPRAPIKTVMLMVETSEIQPTGD